MENQKKLVPEEEAAVNGGAGYGSEFRCPNCWINLIWDHNDSRGMYGYFICPNCGEWTYDRVHRKYEKGWIEY